MKRSRRSANRPGFATEAEMAAVVVAWLVGDGWSVYQEVDGTRITGHTADIVATRGDQVAVVECKLHLNLDVLAQELRWKEHATLIYAAAPAPYHTHDAWNFAATACRAIGMGLLEVHKDRRGWRPEDGPRDEYFTTHVAERVASTAQAVDTTRLRAALHDEQKSYAAAGSPGGKRWTPFRATERDLVAYVTANPGTLARDALRAIHHHWASKSPTARCLDLIAKGAIRGLRVDGDRRHARLFVIETVVP